MPQPLKVVVLTDVHAAAEAVGERRGDLYDPFLLRAVHRCNRYLKPDVVVVLGDLVNNPADADSAAHYARLREILALLACPCLALPGNHDLPPEQFYQALARPPEHFDIKGYRFISFCDPEEPGFNARRRDSDLERMRQARADWSGPIIALQHVPLFPPGRVDVPYNYVNAAEIIAAMRAAGVTLALSGHYHYGMPPLHDDGVCFLTARALCEPPFGFLEVELQGTEISVREHSLRMPPEYGLVDRHIHTQFAYCNENMDMARTGTIAAALGLAGYGFAEHSDQLYCARESWSRADYFAQGLACIRNGESRMGDYWALAESLKIPPAARGLETEFTQTGELMVRPEDRARTGYLVGAVHMLAEMKRDRPEMARVEDEFLTQTQGLLAAGVNILAHPFRAFRRHRLATPSRLFAPMVRLLRASGAAAEINFHTNEPPPEFVRLCLAAGVKLAFGSDAHNQYEIGEFYPHVQLLRGCGYDGDFHDIIYQGPDHD